MQALHLEGCAKLSVAVIFACQSLDSEPQLQPATTKQLQTQSHETQTASKRRQIQGWLTTTEDLQSTDIDRMVQDWLITTKDLQPMDIDRTLPESPSPEILPFTQDLELKGTSNQLGNEQAALLPDPSLPHWSRWIADQVEAIIQQWWGNNPQPCDESEYDFELPNELPNEDTNTIHTIGSDSEDEEKYEEDVVEAPVNENGILPWDCLSESFQQETATLCWLYHR